MLLHKCLNSCSSPLKLCHLEQISKITAKHVLTALMQSCFKSLLFTHFIFIALLDQHCIAKSVKI